MQNQRAAMGFGDLPAQHQADAGAARFRGKERDKQIGGVGETVAFVANIE